MLWEGNEIKVRGEKSNGSEVEKERAKWFYTN